ncbi:MAG TPA: glycosyltransferase [Pseudolabrys sp.]|jgi:glycosyltransferase involved in cell wall biosynthesis|nr:glycosyltransferase [Pseudolabrys sp.]
MPSLPAHDLEDTETSPRSGLVAANDRGPEAAQSREPISVLLVAPTLDIGAADAGVVSLVRILARAGHRTTVVARAGRLVPAVTAAGGEFIACNMETKNPAVILANALLLMRIARQRRCDVIHAHGRAAAWSAYLAARLAGVPFVTSWYKGFREQNVFKRYYNGIMARGVRMTAASEQIAQLIHDRYGTPWEHIAVVPASIDLDAFDPARVSQERIDAVRHVWGIAPETKVILIVGRILRRKGHHIAVRAVQRLKNAGLKDFLCVFVGEDRGRTHYTGELWDLVLSTGTVDVIRMAAPVIDMPAAFAAASVVVSAAIQPEGVQRTLLEAQAMARPVIVSDLGAGPEVVLTPPAVPDNRITGLRFAAGDDSGLATALLRLFAMPEQTRRAIGARGREWVLNHFNPTTIAEQTLAFYRQAAALSRNRSKTGAI